MINIIKETIILIQHNDHTRTTQKDNTDKQIREQQRYITVHSEL